MWNYLWVGGPKNPPPIELLHMRLVEKFGADIMFLPADTVFEFINLLDVEGSVDKAKENMRKDSV